MTLQQDSTEFRAAGERQESTARHALDMPTIGSRWSHATEPGVFVVTDGTLNGLVLWTEEGQAKEYHAPVREFLAVFSPECAGRCYSMTESGAGYIDPKCPKHGSTS